MTNDGNPSGASRRSFLKGSAGATATAALVPSAAVGAGTTGFAGSAAARSDADLSAWFEDADNYDGVTDRTGEDEVTVAVGAADGFAFDPPAVRIDPGTTVVWEWTGDGGSHNVAASDGAFESEATDEEGHTFEFTPGEGVFKYACAPHEAMGMKGALVVGDAEVGAAGSGASAASGISPEMAAVGGSILLGLLSPVAFAVVLFRRGDDGRNGAAANRPRQPSQ